MGDTVWARAAELRVATRATTMAMMRKAGPAFGRTGASLVIFPRTARILATHHTWHGYTQQGKWQLAGFSPELAVFFRKEFSRVFKQSFKLCQEFRSDHAVLYAMVAGEGDLHDSADHDFVVSYHGLLTYRADS